MFECNFKKIRGCSYGGELAWLGGLARLGEIIFIPRSYGIFYLSSVKKFAVAGKRFFDQIAFTINSDVMMQNVCSYSYIIRFTSEKQSKAD